MGLLNNKRSEAISGIKNVLADDSVKEALQNGRETDELLWSESANGEKTEVMCLTDSGYYVEVASKSDLGCFVFNQNLQLAGPDTRGITQIDGMAVISKNQHDVMMLYARNKALEILAKSGKDISVFAHQAGSFKMDSEERNFLSFQDNFDNSEMGKRLTAAYDEAMAEHSQALERWNERMAREGLSEVDIKRMEQMYSMGSFSYLPNPYKRPELHIEAVLSKAGIEIEDIARECFPKIERDTTWEICTADEARQARENAIDTNEWGLGA